LENAWVQDTEDQGRVSNGKPEGVEVLIDHGLCMGAGECVFAAPQVFALDTDSKSRVIADTSDHTEAVLRAAESCPNFAITVMQDGKQIV
jgi:ferredoxin